MSIKRSMELLIKALDAIQENKDKLPPEYAFLTDPKFIEQMKKMPDASEKVMAAAKMLGQEVEVDESKVDELVEYMKQAGLVDREEAPAEGEEGEVPVKGAPAEGDEEMAVEGDPEEGTQPPMEGEMPVENIAEGKEELPLDRQGPSMEEEIGAPMGSGDPIANKIKIARKVARVVEYVLSDEDEV